MLLSRKVDVYRKKNKIVLLVSSGPGGWVSAVWSYCLKSERFELNVSLHSHGLTSLGSMALRATHVSPQFLTNDSELLILAHAPRAMLWHPSGDRIVVIEAGRIFIFGIAWVSKHRRNLQEIQTTTIGMKRANEIYCEQLEEEDQTEREEGNTTAANEMIGVKISVRQCSTHIGATAATLSCTAFANISGPATHPHPHPVGAAVATTTHTAVNTALGASVTHSSIPHSGRILIGTNSGAVLSVGWGLHGDGEDTNTAFSDPLDQSTHSLRTTSTLSNTQHGGYEEYDVEEEGRRRAHSCTNAGRLLATVVCAAANQGDTSTNEDGTASHNAAAPTTAVRENSRDGLNTEENRDLLRVWKESIFPLHSAATNNNSNSTDNTDSLPEVLDIGDIGNFSTHRAGGGDNLVEVDLNMSHHDSSESTYKGSSSHAVRTVSYWSASAVREITCGDRNKTLLLLYGDGSFSVSVLVPVVIHVPLSAPTVGLPYTYPSATAPKTALLGGTLPTPRTSAMHTFVVHSTAKIHPVVLVAYPIVPPVTVPGANVKGGVSHGISAPNAGM